MIIINDIMTHNFKELSDSYNSCNMIYEDMQRSPWKNIIGEGSRKITSMQKYNLQEVVP